MVVGKTCKIIIASGGTYDEGLPAAASDCESGYLKHVLAFIGITEVEIILAGGTAAVVFGATTAEDFTAQIRPAVLAAAPCCKEYPTGNALGTGERVAQTRSPSTRQPIGTSPVLVSASAI